MNIRQVIRKMLFRVTKKNSAGAIHNQYIKRFNANAFTEGHCTQYGQFEASITKLYHSVEKGLSYQEYKAGFGKQNIEKLILSMRQYADKYNANAFFYQTALSVLWQYIDKNREYGLIDEELEKTVRSLSGEPNDKGGVISVSNPGPTVRTLGYKDFVESRHSIRQFSNEPVNVEVIRQAIELAQFTPSACNRQGWKCKVVSDKELIKKLMANQNGNRGFGEGIDKLVVIVSDLHYFSKGREVYQAFIDGGMYAMNMLHALHYCGIGTIPLSASLTTEQEENVRKLLKMEDSEILIMFVGCGNYPEGEILTTRSERRSPEVEIY